MIFRNNRKILNREIDPDEIFLDSKNLPDFDTQQFEGRLEKPISKRIIYYLGSFFVLVLLIFIYKSVNLQIVEGQTFYKKSENNTLMKKPIFADRGVIYDRNNVPLAWNSWSEESAIDKFSSPIRSYLENSGLSLLLGYVSQPTKDSSGKYWQEYFLGKDGLEKYYDDILTGTNGVLITEIDVAGEVQYENVVSKPTMGDNLVLSIDSRIQKKMYESISKMATNSNFVGGAGILMDINNGEILAMTSYPEFNSNVLSLGKDKKTIDEYLNDKRKVFLNRAVSGLYAPGSIVKPFVGYAALTEKVITPLQNIFANGTMTVPNPYFPDKPSIFKDHGIFGYVDMRRAIAISSDIYFYQVGGGYKEQSGLGIVKIDNYMKMFGVASQTGLDLGGDKEGTIPTPEWKLKVYNGDPWRVGDTYNSSIGQYGFQVTPIQMARAVGAIANNGTLLTPHLKKGDLEKENLKVNLNLNLENLKIVKEGMRMAVTEGTATALNIPSVKVAAKTGTAQVGLGNTNTNSWVIGFFPYDNPKYGFAILMDRGPKQASGNSTWVMREIIDYMSLEIPEYLSS